MQPVRRLIRRLWPSIRPSFQSRRFRPSLECLEDRVVPAAPVYESYFGGSVIKNIEVQPIYYGSSWNTTYASLQTQIDTFFNFLVTSQYMSLMNQYGVSDGATATSHVDTSGPSEGNIDDSNNAQSPFLTSLNNALASNSVVSPAANVLYYFIVPPGVTVTEQNGESGQPVTNVLGYHSNFTATVNGKGVQVNYAVTPVPLADNPSTPDFNSFTVTASHEVAEAATDPVPVNAPGSLGYTWTNANPSEQGEVADVAGSIPGTILGPNSTTYYVEPLFSDQTLNLVVPTPVASAPSISVNVGADNVTENPNFNVPLSTPQQRVSVATEFLASTEYSTKQITATYQKLLKRAPTQQEINGYLPASGQTYNSQQTLTDILGTAEYFQDNGSTNQSWLQSLYQNLLNRAPDSSGDNALLTGLNNGTLTRAEVVVMFVNGAEYRSDQVQVLYSSFLRRSASSTEVQSWVQQLQAGTSIESVIIGIVSSAEYANARNQILGYLTGMYIDLLQRPPDQAGYLQLMASVGVKFSSGQD